MKILALDSSSEACSVALMVDGDVLTRHELAPRKHAELLLPFVEQVLEEAGLTIQQVDALAFGRGPGAFTGIRIATGVAQGIAFAVDLPVVPVSTLAALAQGSGREQGVSRVITAMDARMGEVYWGAFKTDEHGLMQAVAEECVLPPHDAPLLDDTEWYGCGSGWASYGTVLAECYDGRLAGTDADRLPNAIDVAALAIHEYRAGHFLAAEQALPVYLRDKVAEKKR